MDFIDLRSDTVTQPTQAMRDVMYHAVVGDDVFEDDPTINELEMLAAQILGKEAALFVTSGTQGNAVCVMTHTYRGDAILVGRGCHITDHEAGAYAILAGVSPCYAEDEAGIIKPESLRRLIIDDSELQIARTGLVCMENALSNGGVVPLERMREIYEIAHEKGVPVHLDGARIFNAAAALHVDVKEMTQYCDTVMCCLSKGLCAPVGSIVAGSAAFIRKARKNRKILGGGLRQAGFLAAAGKIALTDMTKRVGEDHDNALYLAEGLEKLPGVHLDRARVQINMVFFSVDWKQNLVENFPTLMHQKGIKVTGYMDGEYRFVTNNDVSRQDCDTILATVAELIATHNV